jgi:hypothetical protein
VNIAVTVVGSAMGHLVCRRMVPHTETGRRTMTAYNIAVMRRAIEAAGLRLLFDQKGAAAGRLCDGDA